MPVFTGFLSLAEQSDLLHARSTFPLEPLLYGGHGNAERRVAAFGLDEGPECLTDFPITTIRVCPVSAKYADSLTHRDFLGALMNLGVERKVLGDILTNGKEAYIFCLSGMAEYITGSLTKVKHTQVEAGTVQEITGLNIYSARETVEIVPSLRLDAVISKVYRLPRTKSQQLVAAGKVYINSRLCQKEARELKEGDLVSVRGMGRFKYRETAGSTVKGNLRAVLEVY